MSLEKEIQQKQFRNEYQKGIINVIYTYNWLNEKMKAIFEHEGITSQQYNILRILKGSGKPMSTLQIRERMLDKMSDTSRIVDRLVTKGLVKKSICKMDKRLVDVNISQAGEKLLANLIKHENHMDAILGNLSDSEIKSLNKLLDKIRQ